MNFIIKYLLSIFRKKKVVIAIIFFFVIVNINILFKVKNTKRKNQRTTT